MKTNVPIGRWLGLLSAAVAVLAQIYLYFNPVFVNDFLLDLLTSTVAIGSLIALVLSLLTIPSWQSKVTIVLLVLMLLIALNTSLGIH
ncbi:MAG: hypothetical protein IPM63_04985 [Acidobacteriota bacterium]|nr:MAG: hypothetical protein IPM63_04985 [Acidobacteriota bacterium]